MEKDEIDELIAEAEGRQLEILIQLKYLNQQAYFWQRQFKMSWKQKYNKMWSQKFWKEARQLLKEYSTIENNGIFQCQLCKKELDSKFVLHHDFYPKNPNNFFNPLYLKLICNSCNYKEHKDKYE
jgi:hypothetical protein